MHRMLLAADLVALGGSFAAATAVVGRTGAPSPATTPSWSTSVSGPPVTPRSATARSAMRFAKAGPAPAPIATTRPGARRAGRPCSRARCVTEELVTVPPGVDRDGLEAYRLRVETAIQHATDLAERWAEEDVTPFDAQPLAEADDSSQKQAG